MKSAPKLKHLNIISSAVTDLLTNALTYLEPLVQSIQWMLIFYFMVIHNFHEN